MNRPTVDSRWLDFLQYQRKQIERLKHRANEIQLNTLTSLSVAHPHVGRSVRVGRPGRAGDRGAAGGAGGDLQQVPHEGLHGAGRQEEGACPAPQGLQLLFIMFHCNCCHGNFIYSLLFYLYCI